MQFHYGVTTSYVFNNFLLVLFSATLQRFCAALECNSIMVRLKAFPAPNATEFVPDFNSTLVRLKAKMKDWKRAISTISIPLWLD